MQNTKGEKMSIKECFKEKIQGIKKFQGIIWLSTIFAFLGLSITGHITGIPFYFKAANLIAVLYWIYALAISETGIERQRRFICLLIFLFFLFWI